jgi:hypothetical protein
MLPPLTAGSPSVLLAVERANRMPPMTGEIDGGQRMTGTEVRAGFEELWPPGEMNRLWPAAWRDRAAAHAAPGDVGARAGHLGRDAGRCQSGIHLARLPGV